MLAAQAGSTRATIVFFTNFGVAYTCRLIDVPASTGYGEPVQRLFKFKDGERVVAAFSASTRAVGRRHHAGGREHAPTRARRCRLDRRLRAPLPASTVLPSRARAAGRRFARPAGAAEIVGVELVRGGETLIAVTREARAMLCPVEEINFLSGPGKGVILIKMREKDDRVLGFIGWRRATAICWCRDHARRRADGQHGEIRGHRSRRPGPRAAAARTVHAGRADRRRMCRRRSTPADRQVIDLTRDDTHGQHGISRAGARAAHDPVGDAARPPRPGDVGSLVELGEHLDRAISAFHMEAIRFRMFTLARHLKDPALPLPDEVHAQYDAVRRVARGRRFPHPVGPVRALVTPRGVRGIWCMTGTGNVGSSQVWSNLAACELTRA